MNNQGFKTPSWVLFLVASVIWGTTWYAIKMQLTSVPPLFSIAYRFSLASLVLLVYLAITGHRLKFSIQNHLWFVLQGIFLFGLCYWLTYVAETELTSGLVAILTCLIILFNILLGRLFLKRPISPKLLIGAFIGITGIVLLFKDELQLKAQTGGIDIGILTIAVVANLFASIGNIVSARNQGAGLPVQQTNAFGMLYGALLMFVLAFARGDEIAFEGSLEYVGSLLYLAIFGSIIAFSSYLTLVGRLGPGKAAYTTLIIPVIALSISTLFESFTWTIYAVIGLLLVLAGNYVALRKN